MTLFTITFCLIITAATSLLTSAQQQLGSQAVVGSPQQVPRSFTSEEGGFSISLPGPPPPQKGKPGNRDYHEYKWPTNLGTFIVRYTDADRPLENNLSHNPTLLQLRDALIAQSSGQAERDTEIALGDFPGREIVINDAKGIYLQRFYVVGRRIYDVNAYLPDQLRAARERAEKILGSFSLTKPPAVTLGEADKLIKSLREKNELTLGKCAAEDTRCVPLKGWEDSDGGSDSNSTSARNPMRSGVINGKVISKPQPEYPAIAKASRASGVVQVLIVVDEQGRMMAAQAVTGHPLLQPTAVIAARGAKFTPTLLDGKPVKVTGMISFAFILQ